MKLCSGEISFVLQLQTCESQDQQEEPCPPAQPQVSNPSSDTQTESNQVLSSPSYPHYLLVGDNLDKNTHQSA